VLRRSERRLRRILRASSSSPAPDLGGKLAIDPVHSPTCTGAKYFSWGFLQDALPTLCPASDWLSVCSTPRKAVLLHHLRTSFRARLITADSRGVARQKLRPSCSFLRFSKQETFSGSVSLHEFNAGSL
jgi:hypothetical protein